MSQHQICIGIDIGKNGAIVAIYPDDTIVMKAVPKIGNQIDQQALNKIFKELTKPEKMYFDSVMIAMEDVHSIFGAGAKSNFEFGRSLGLVEGLVTALEIPYLKVTPKTWQKVSLQGVMEIKKPGKREHGRGSNDTKAMALLAAQRLYPKADFRKNERCKVAHDGIVDALLIAHYIKHKG